MTELAKLAKLEADLRAEYQARQAAPPAPSWNPRVMGCPLCRRPVEMIGASATHARYRCKECLLRFNVVKRSLQAARDLLRQRAAVTS